MYVCLHVSHVCLVPTKLRRRCNNQSYGWFPHHVCAGNWSWVFCNTASILNYGNISSVPGPVLFVLFLFILLYKLSLLTTSWILTPKFFLVISDWSTMCTISILVFIFCNTVLFQFAFKMQSFLCNFMGTYKVFSSYFPHPPPWPSLGHSNSHVTTPFSSQLMPLLFKIIHWVLFVTLTYTLLCSLPSSREHGRPARAHFWRSQSPSSNHQLLVMPELGVGLWVPKGVFL